MSENASPTPLPPFDEMNAADVRTLLAENDELRKAGRELERQLAQALGELAECRNRIGGVKKSLFAFIRNSRLGRFPFRPLTCMCVAYSENDAPHWRPCPSSLCQHRSHTLGHRIATSGRDYRYGGLGAWARWIVRGVSADEGDC